MENYLIKNMIEVIKLFLYVFTIRIAKIQYITTFIEHSTKTQYIKTFVDHSLHNVYHSHFHILNKKGFCIHILSSGKLLYDEKSDFIY